MAGLSLPLIDPAPMRLSEAKAAKVLLTIAALQGGIVNRLANLNVRAAGSDEYMTVAGLAVMVNDPSTPGTVWSGMRRNTWVWAKELGALCWMRPDALGDRVIPIGRIDRGLGAVK